MKAHLKCAKIMSKSIWLLEKGHSFKPNIFYASTEKKDQEVGYISCEVNFESRNVEWPLNPELHKALGVLQIFYMDVTF